MTPLLTAGDIIDRSAQFYRTHSRKIFRVIGWYLLAGLGSVAAELLLAKFFPGREALRAAATGALTLIVAGVSLLTTIRLIRLVAGEVRGRGGEPPADLAAWRRLFWHTALAMLGSSVLIFFGTAALVIPGALFWVWFSFTSILTALGETTARQSFARSRQLSAGRFGAVLWRLAAPTIFFFLLQMVVLFLITLLLQGGIIGVWSIEPLALGAPLGLLLAMGGIQEIIRIALAPLFIFSTALLYFSLEDSKAIVDRV